MRKTLLAEMLSAGRPVARMSVCLLAITATPVMAAEAAAGDVEFNTSFLDSAYTSGVDLKQFSRGNGMQAGEYLTDVWLNDDLLGTEKLTFSKMADGQVAVCMTPALLAHLNVRASALHNTDKLSAGQCTPVEQVIPSAHLTWDNGQQKLVIAVPQEDLEKTARGSVPPSLWQNGSLAAFAAYNASAYQSASGGETFNSQYLSLNSGLNLGGWYLRHNGSLTNQTGSGSQYQSINTYIQHDVTPLRGRFLAGQANTSGRLFDSLSYTGVSLFSDDQMLPESQRGYAPEIRGIARSSARVTVRQGGNVIYETTVPAGAFVINDLYPTGYGGDLSVTVREADGSESVFLVPYASVADLLRPGASRYEAVAGTYRQPNGRDGQPFYQATWQQGITNILTLYGGAQFSDGYQAYQAGSAVSTQLGAVALDITQASTSTVRDKLSGQSYRITYNKLVSDTQSNVVNAPGAAGAEVSSYPGLKLDHWGNAVMPASMPYQKNTVSLDPKGLSDRVELESTTQNVVPREGAVVVAEFATQQGYALLLTPTRPEGGLPFGTTVTDSQGNTAGMVGQGGMVYARVKDRAGKLFATVNGQGKAATCIMPFSVTDETKAMQQNTYTCSK
ncbi:TPA: fimbria/pilus outer membrane usher protein [Salmonella enterica subsp. diarizonae serovar 61:l,v:z35]